MIRRIIVCLIATYFGVKGWKGDTKLKLNNQFHIGIGTLIFLVLMIIAELKGIDVDDKLDKALTPDSWENKQYNPRLE